MMCGRFIFGLGFEPINSVKGIITAKWFCGGELSLAVNLNLSIARIFVFLSSFMTPLVVEKFGYTQAFMVGCIFASVFWMSAFVIVTL